MTALSGWENFYVIVGSSAGALIGLQFIAISLIADMPLGHASEQAGHAFATPTIVHFCAVLLLAALLTAPWQAVDPAAAVWVLLGMTGVIYSVIVTHRMRRQSAYKPQLEDWIFHALLPFIAYLILAASGTAVRSHTRDALFAVAAVTLLLLFIGIHNTWDAVTYHVFVQRQKRPAEQQLSDDRPQDVR